MENTDVDTQVSVAVPLHERASIRPKELADLRGQLKQAEGEFDYQHDVSHELLWGLGFDDDWNSLQGVKDAIRDVLAIAAGKMSREEFGEVAKGSIIEAIFQLRDQIETWHRVEEAMPDDDTTVQIYNEKGEEYFIAWHAEGHWWTEESDFSLSNISHWRELVPPEGVTHGS